MFYIHCTIVAKNEDVRAIIFAGTSPLKQCHSESVERYTLHLLLASSKTIKNN